MVWGATIKSRKIGMEIAKHKFWEERKKQGEEGGQDLI